MSDPSELSRRERQIMDVVWRLGRATVTDVFAAMDDPPTRTSVRTLMRILEEKGHLKHELEGREFVYASTRPRQRVGQRALHRVVQTFFGGSVGEALAAHLANPDSRLDESELQRLHDLIRQAREKGKQS
jgi:predicted transcriptional regulator